MITLKNCVTITLEKSPYEEGREDGSIIMFLEAYLKITLSLLKTKLKIKTN